MTSPAAPPIYLDNNATTRVLPEAVDAMLPYFSHSYGNASSVHGFGAEVAAALRGARQSVQRLIGAASASEIIFTSGGTEANTSAIQAALAARPGRNEIVISAVEHPSILAPCAALERQGQVRVHRIGVDAEGRLDLDATRAVLSDRVALVSLMWANNETGTVFPVDGLAEWAHQVGALFHTDAVQAVGKTPIDLAQSEIDMLSLSAHKFHGPKGVGALYLRQGVSFAPLLLGGRQERARRAGTENVPGIVGAGKAAEIVSAQMAETLPRVAALRDRLQAGLMGAIPRAQMLGDRRDRLANTACLAFDFVEAEMILLRLAQEGIAASSGSACAAGGTEPSHVLRAMAVPFSAAHGAVRFSLSRFTTGEEIDRVLALLPQIVADLRAMSPFWADIAPAMEASKASAGAAGGAPC